MRIPWRDTMMPQLSCHTLGHCAQGEDQQRAASPLVDPALYQTWSARRLGSSALLRFHAVPGQSAFRGACVNERTLVVAALQFTNLRATHRTGMNVPLFASVILCLTFVVRDAIAESTCDAATPFKVPCHQSRPCSPMIASVSVISGVSFPCRVGLPLLQELWPCSTKHHRSSPPLAPTLPP